MARRTLERATTYREVHAALSHHPALRSTRNGGPHTIYQGPRGSVPVPNHNGDVPRGTLRNIGKLALLAGLAVLIVALVLMT